MALFKKNRTLEEVIADFEKLSDEEKEKFKSHITESDTAEEKTEAVEDEPAVEADTETETEETETEEKAEVEGTEGTENEETVDETEEKFEETEEPETTEEPEETVDEVKEEVKEETEAKDAKLEALMDEFAIIKEKVEKLYARLEDNDKPADEVGLTRQDSVGEEKDDDDLSAYEYAKKYGKY